MNQISVLQKKTILAFLFLGILLGSAIGYSAAAYGIYQPQIAKLQTDLSKTKSDLDSVQSEMNILQTNLDQLNINYSALKSDYSTLQTSYDNLGLNYSGLKSDYARLNSSYSAMQRSDAQLNSAYTQLSRAYSQAQSNYTEEATLRIGTTLETYDDYTRANYAPLSEESWYQYPNYYNLSVGFAAEEAAHDAGQLYWPNLENTSSYYNMTGEYSYTTANRIITSALTYSGINANDSEVAKIDKVLKFISTRVQYQSRLLDHMWFPTETFTFKSGDCTSFTILVACMLEKVGIKSAAAFFNNSAGLGHAMVLVHLTNLGTYMYTDFSDLTSYGLVSGKWIIIEPQYDSLLTYSANLDWVSQWSLLAASEVPYGP